MENFERIASGIVDECHISLCKGSYCSKDCNIPADEKIKNLIVSALQSQHSQHEREVDELRQGMGQACPHRPHPKRSETEFDDPEIRGQKFGEAAGINWASYTMLKAFDRIRAQQSERRAKQEGEDKL